MMIDRKTIEAIKRKYLPGMKIRLVRMDDIQAPSPGTIGTIVGVDDIGSVLVKWETGSSLSVIPGEDEFEII